MSENNGEDSGANVVVTKTNLLQTTTTRFADYFVICGLDLDTGLEPDRFAGKYLFMFYKIIVK